MTDCLKPEAAYTERLHGTENDLKVVNKKILYVSLLRVLLFVAAFVIVILMWQYPAAVIMGAAACAVIPFLVLIKVHNRLFSRKQWLEVRADLLRKELKGLEHDYSGFDGGREFIDAGHLYSFDIDLFGGKSLFQAMNRTCTGVGKQTLAHWLQNHLRDKQQIEERQACVRDLCGRMDFREEFSITGHISGSSKNDVAEVVEWAAADATLAHSAVFKMLVWGVPVVNILLLAGGLSGLISMSWFGLALGLFVILSFGVVKRATMYQEEYGKKLKVLSVYARLIARMQREDWQAAGIRQLLARLEINGKYPDKALQELTRELDRLDLRNNQLLYVVLEGTMFFQLRQLMRIEQWRLRYGRYLEGWLQAVGEMDALCSLAAFAYNHPRYVYPQITDRPFCFVAREMGHPLMRETQCVKNDACIPARPYFLIVTGANMAGKSTYLRTIGVNYLLACVGAPVCCEELRIYTAQLITSLRTSDSLSDNESYFFAELKRLKRIIDLLEQGEELFIILDEILKGTNSADKQKGSFNLIKQFVKLKANGIIATHDLLLGELEHHFPDEIRNYCFEADIADNELTFSYRIREGIAQNMNACFLMKKMGIAFED